MSNKHLIIKKNGILVAVKPVMEKPDFATLFYRKGKAHDKAIKAWQQHIQSLPSLHLDPSIKGKEGDRVDGVEVKQYKHPMESDWKDGSFDYDGDLDTRITLKAVAHVIKVRVKYCHGEASGGHCCYPDESYKEMCDVVPSPDQSQEAPRQATPTIDYIHKGIEFAGREAFKTTPETYRSGIGFGYSCGYQDGVNDAAHPAEEWVAMLDRLPDERDCVLWCKVPVCEPPTVASMLDVDFRFKDYTHWRPLPAPPSNQNKK